MRTQYPFLEIMAEQFDLRPLLNRKKMLFTQDYHPKYTHHKNVKMIEPPISNRLMGRYEYELKILKNPVLIIDRLNVNQ